MKLVTMITISIFLGAVGFLGCKGGDGGGGRAAPAAKTMYNCAMHPQYISDKPGFCPICGMKLTPMDKGRHAADPGAGAPGSAGSQAAVPAGGSVAGAGSSVAGAGSGAAGRIAYYRDPMHPWITSDRPGKSPDCGMDLVPVYEGGGAGVRIDPATVQNMGVKTEAVERRDLRPEIRASGTVKVDESRLAAVNARVAGYVEKLSASVTGQRVRKGETLLELYSPDLVSAQEEYLQALRYAQMAGAETGARDLAESARRRLLNWGVAASEIAALEKGGRARNTLPIAAPISGVVIAKSVVQGQNVAAGTELYRIADLSRVWIVAAIYQRDLGGAAVGAEADVELNYLPGKPFKGRITFVSPVLDEQTKTAEVRVETPNTPALDFKPEMFATVRIAGPARRGVVAIPEQAVIRSGRRNLAVVAVGGGYFEPREVKLGVSSGDYVEVLEGLHEGERLVVSSQFLIDSESNLKAAIDQMRSQGEGRPATMAPPPVEGR